MDEVLSFLVRVFTETETLEPLDILLRMMLAFFTKVLMLLELDCPVAWEVKYFILPSPQYGLCSLLVIGRQV